MRHTLPVAVVVGITLAVAGVARSAPQNGSAPGQAPTPPATTTDAASTPESVTAEDPASDEVQSRHFERRVRPLLVERCQKCHGPQEQKGGLRLDSRAAALAGGDSGPAIVPGDPPGSLLMSAIEYGDVVQMPPDGRLPAELVSDLRVWIAAGAPWPGSDDQDSRPRPTATVTAEDRTFWSYQPVCDPPMPRVRNAEWPRSPLDQLVLAKLEAAGLEPAPPAERRTLVRRLTFDLCGLPPTPVEVDEFLADDAPDAVDRLVDRLLASPRYGERWGRHWLDVARYADSNGLDENLAQAEAYRYRDWVIGAFQRDEPYDQFLRAQIAGDLLPSVNDAQRMDYLAATGFLCLGPKMLAEDDPVKMEMDIVDEQLDTVFQAFMGVTIGCARCHDHKFDPLSAVEYYGLASIFKSTQTMDTFSVVARWHERPLVGIDQERALATRATERRLLQTAFDTRQTQALEAATIEARSQVAEYLLAAQALASSRRPLEPKMQAGAAPPDDGLLCEAETFARGNVKIDFEVYGAGIGVVYNAGELPNLAEYDVTVARSGKYQIDLRYAAAEARPVRLIVDGQELSSTAARRATGSWTPETQCWEGAAQIALEPGPHVVRLERSGPFPHFDKLALVRVGDFSTASETLATANSDAPTAPRELRQGYLERFTAAMAQTLETPRGPLAAWANLPGLLSADRADPVTTFVLRDPLPPTPEALAARYRELTEQAFATEPDPATAVPATAWREFLTAPAAPLATPEATAAYLTPTEMAAIDTLRTALREHDAATPTVPWVMAVAEGTPTALPIHVRGSHLNLGELAPRQLPEVLRHPFTPELPHDQSGRVQLADWIAHPANPLTARVMVNRVWRWHFGTGLVRTCDNFGRLGDRPSHPELLDWLASRFMESGWSIKHLHRLILNSATYQMSSRWNAVAAAVDPDNRLHWRMDRQRLDAESLRDAILAVGGQLDTTMGGSLLVTKNREYVAGTASVNPTSYAAPRRSVYLPVVRSALYDVFQAFDFADPSVINGDRATTTVAPQTLFAMNSELVTEQSLRLAERLLHANHPDDAARVQAAFQIALGRDPLPEELSEALTYLATCENESAAPETPDAPPINQVWQSLVRAILATNEFIYVD